jgi:hypothetical protein
LAHLAGNVLDAERRARQREQLESLANVSNAFNQAQETEHVLSALATALAKASGFDWVVIETYDETGEVMLERTLNVARYSATDTAASWRNDKVVPTGTGQLQFGAALARAGKPFLMPDVHDEQAWERRQQANPVDPVPLRKFYERAHHPPSSGRLPAEDGGISFVTPHAFEAAEVEFLTALRRRRRPRSRPAFVLEPQPREDRQRENGSGRSSSLTCRPRIERERRSGTRARRSRAS